MNPNRFSSPPLLCLKKREINDFRGEKGNCPSRTNSDEERGAQKEKGEPWSHKPHGTAIHIYTVFLRLVARPHKGVRSGTWFNRKTASKTERLAEK
jgi:hypothetical protein